MIQTDLIRRSADLVSIARSYGIPLRKSGTQLTGPCPFHREHTAGGAFHVHPAKQVFACHSCGAHGDVFHLVRHMEGLPDFPQTARRVAELAGVPWTDEPWTAQRRREYARTKAAAQEIGIECAEFWRGLRRYLTGLVNGLLQAEREAAAWCLRYCTCDDFDELPATERAWIIFRVVPPVVAALERHIDSIDNSTQEDLVRVYADYRAAHPEIPANLRRARETRERFAAAIAALIVAKTSTCMTTTRPC